MRVPEVLMTGDHRRIAEWKRQEAERLTRERRPDLWRRLRESETDGRVGDEAAGEEAGAPHNQEQRGGREQEQADRRLDL